MDNTMSSAHLPAGIIDEKPHTEAAGVPTGEVELQSELVRTESKRIYFNLKQNDRGRFLKIAEVRNGTRNAIIIPESGWARCRDVLDRFVKGDFSDSTPQPEPESNASGLQLWVMNLSWETTDDAVRDAFSRFGTVEAAAVQRRRDGRSHGTATVRFTNTEDAARAMAEMADQELDGRPIRVRLDRQA